MPYLVEFFEKAKRVQDGRMSHVFISSETFILPWSEKMTLKRLQHALCEAVQLSPKKYTLLHVGHPVRRGRFCDLGIFPGACLKVVLF